MDMYLNSWKEFRKEEKIAAPIYQRGLDAETPNW